MDDLLKEVKNYLDINFVDDDSDKKLTGIIKRGISYLSEVAGTDLTGKFILIEDAPDTYTRQLLFDYCRYARSNDVESFKNNFQSELLMLRAKKEVEYYYESKQV